MASTVPDAARVDSGLKPAVVPRTVVRTSRCVERHGGVGRDRGIGRRIEALSARVGADDVLCGSPGSASGGAQDESAEKYAPAADATEPFILPFGSCGSLGFIPMGSGRSFGYET
jgi:hypothetical protein